MQAREHTMVIRLGLKAQNSEVIIHIEQGSVRTLAQMIPPQYHAHAIVLLTDSTVATLYGDMIVEQCKDFARWKGVITIPAGEASKSRAIRDAIEDELFARECGRDTLLLALGGGVVGDLAGFVAATFCRGIPFVSIPTTLMAMTDSAIGGKTGINHASGKNLLGAFYHPHTIVIDPQLLDSLPDAEFIGGLAEVVKYGCIGDEQLFALLEESSSDVLARTPEIIQELIIRSVSQKVQVVSHDEKESGLRAILNFGHTTAHALEQLSHYKLAHGLAVYQGMVLATHLSCRKGLITHEQCKRILRVIGMYNIVDKDALQTRSALHALRECSADEIWRACANDKKNSGGNHKFVLLETIGRAREPLPISKEEFFQAYHDAVSMP